MKTLTIGISLLASLALAVNAARVPPSGLTISERDRNELRSGADALAREIDTLRAAPMAALLPDVEIYHKAVDWPLRYDEFYRSNEVGQARTLLKQGLERARQLREGKPAWLTATGLVVRGYVSKIDGSVQPYGLVVPATFATSRNYIRRLDVWLHGRDDKLTELKFISDREKSYGEFTPTDAFVLHPYGRYCNAFKFAGETDVFEAMEHVKKSYRIDNQRIALRGFSMGGAGAWHLGAHHPDVWAVVSPGAGFAETAEYQKLGANRDKVPSWEQKLWQLYDATDYAANFVNVPVIAYNGTEDPQRQAADVMERAMKAEGLKLPRVWGTNVPHKWTPEAKREVSAFVDAAVAKRKEYSSPHARFTTRTLRYNQSPNFEILGLLEHWKPASVDGDSSGPGRWKITTTNVAAFRLKGQLPSVDPSQWRFEIDGMAATGSGVIMSGNFNFPFYRGTNGDWRGERLFEFAPDGRLLKVAPIPLGKKHGLQGPIDDAFMDSFVVVRPSGKARDTKIDGWIASQLAKATNDWRAQFRGDARVKDDSQVTDADIAAHNLVLFGDPQSNRLLARIADKLPIQWSVQTIRVGDKTFPSASHVPVFIFPNPLNPKRYVVLNSGITFAAAGAGSNASQTPKLPDYAVLDVEHGDAVVLADFFDEEWRLR